MRVLRLLASMLGLVVLTFLSISCGSDVSPSASSASVDPPTKEDTAPSESGLAEDEAEVVLGASWAMTYVSIADLADAADVVVLGNMGVGAQTVDFDTNAQDHGIAFSTHPFQVEQVMKGPISAGSSIMIVQTGGEIDDRVFEIRDDPLFTVGQAYVLFLRRAPDDLFVVLGGPDGRFVVDDGLVSSLSSVYPDRNISDVGIDQADLTAFSDEVKSALVEQQ